MGPLGNCLCLFLFYFYAGIPESCKIKGFQNPCLCDQNLQNLHRSHRATGSSNSSRPPTHAHNRGQKSCRLINEQVQNNAERALNTKQAFQHQSKSKLMNTCSKSGKQNQLCNIVDCLIHHTRRHIGAKLNSQIEYCSSLQFNRKFSALH